MAYRPVRKKTSRIWDFQLKLILPMNLRLSGHFCINCNAKMGYFTMVVPQKAPHRPNIVEFEANVWL